MLIKYKNVKRNKNMNLETRITPLLLRLQINLNCRWHYQSELS